MKYGVRMTAMPAWGKSYDDAHIWSVAAFLHQKVGLSAADYKALTSGD
jgi:mono/diheme cytochrome c family protein